MAGSILSLMSSRLLAVTIKSSAYLATCMPDAVVEYFPSTFVYFLLGTVFIQHSSSPSRTVLAISGDITPP